MQLLLTNDDGIDAPGLAALRDATAHVGPQHTLAPSQPQSGISHQITMGHPLVLTAVDATRHSLAGTPADCVRVALTHLQIQPAWVLAGINRGGNLGADLYTSGTVAAAREAALFGLPAMAISQYVAKDRKPEWELSARRARRVIDWVLQQPRTALSFWNINLPHPDHDDEDLPIAFCKPDTSTLDVRYVGRDGALHYAGSYHDRPRQPGHDVDVCFGGSVAVTEVPLQW